MNQKERQAASLAGVRACIFDAYGTLFDVHSAVARHASALGEAAPAISSTWRQKQLEYSWLRSLMGAYVDFWTITTDALDVALARHGGADADVRRQLLDAYMELSPYPEVSDVLARLGAAGVARAILSNGAPAMLDAAVANAGLEASFEAVLSVDELGLYKPDPRTYALAVDRLNVAVDDTAFFSSNAWDAHGAAQFGFRVVWVDRFAAPSERLPGTFTATIHSLAEIPALFGHG